MYKHAEETRSAVLAQDSIPAEQVRSARFRPSVRSRPIALEPTSSDAEGSGGGPLAARPVAVAVFGAGGLAVILMALVLFFGGSGGPGVLPDDASPSAPVTTPAPTPDPTPPPRPTSTPDGPPETAPVAGPILIRYQVQEGERLLRVAEKWGTTRPAIVRANRGQDDPREARAGDVILVPVPAGTPTEQIEATPGFLGYADE